MHGIMPMMRRVLLGVAATAIFVTVTHGQSIFGPPSEANHFIETPKGWVHPKTPWGEPDIQATLNMMQAANVPLERCANSYRFGGPPCDMNQEWWTEAEYKERVAAATGRVDQGRDLIAKGEFGRALLTGVTDPATPQRPYLPTSPNYHVGICPPAGPSCPPAIRLTREEEMLAAHGVLPVRIPMLVGSAFCDPALPNSVNWLRQLAPVRA
jgi:hypothetical protein